MRPGDTRAAGPAAEAARKLALDAGLGALIAAHGRLTARVLLVWALMIVALVPIGLNIALGVGILDQGGPTTVSLALISMGGGLFGWSSIPLS